jgi:hypothetical protein
LQVDGFTISRLKVAPALSDACGKYFTYRDLIQCGETQKLTNIPNVPQNPESFGALYDLVTQILDPVVEYFGRIELTYGFCSRELAKHVRGRNAPKLDQHAALELNTRGAPICNRSGAAVDFLVRDESMRLVADWIIDNLPFDRLYFYGDDRPLHVSYGPDGKRDAFEVRRTAKGTYPYPYKK